ncbi:FxSxx-COOH system tetratricopeptide repeat protein [Actinoplanes sp. NPDC023801]|uniref:FxSxx-COOH system tetratricopeptide repeat protein n=1 Tax=Actinoplanes sp. NPDC023801 TaxID=3154595 RepID=UPI0033C4807C
MASSAVSRLASIRERLPSGTLELACHVAVPVAFDAGFLNLVRVNFFLDPPIVLPYHAEAALLLSPLCRELGEGLYEIDPQIRDLLLSSLVATFGNERLERTAILLEMYTDRRQAWSLTPELEYAQRLTALNLLNPDAAQRWLHEAREQSEGTDALSREWFVAMDLRNSKASRREDLNQIMATALRRMETGDAEAVREVGELVLLPGSEPAGIVPALERAARTSTEAGQTARRVLRTLRRLFPDLPGPEDPASPGPARRKIFISYVGADRAWAEWARWHLEAAGFAAELTSAEWVPIDSSFEGKNELPWLSDPVLLLLSKASTVPGFMADYIAARLTRGRPDPDNLIPLHIDNVDLSSTNWALRFVPSVAGLDSAEAVQLLLDTVGSVLGPPPGPASKGAGSGPRLPGSLPPVWNLSRRNSAFIGRDDVLNPVHDVLSQPGARVAVHGLIGVGKSQLALEFAYRYADEYDLVWWISAEHAGLIGEQIGALCLQLGIVGPEAHPMVAMSKIEDSLTARARWLLVFDNVVAREDILPWLPRDNGHVLVTSRSEDWRQITPSVELDVLPRAEAVQFLLERRPDLAAGDAVEIAQALGDLPLALTQAADYLSVTAVAGADYLQLLVQEMVPVLELGQPIDYPQSLADAIASSMAALSEADPAAAAVVRLCAMLALEPVSIEVLVALAQPSEEYPRVLEPLREVIGGPLARQESIGRIGAYGLARLSPGTVEVHRLTQAVVRSQMGPSETAELRKHLESRLAQMRPGDPTALESWPVWIRLLPQVLALDPGRNATPALRDCAHDAVRYLVSRGDIESALNLAEKLAADWREQLGADHPGTLSAASDLATVLRASGEYRQAVQISRDVWERMTRVLGAEHPDTLRAGSDIAWSLMLLERYQEALALLEQVRMQRRRVLGEDHPDTLMSADNVAAALTKLGRHREALAIQEQLQVQRRRVLGEDHPDTLRSALNLAVSYLNLRQILAARRTADQAWEGLRKLFGPEHPDTQRAAAVRSTITQAMGGRADGETKRRR